MKGREQWEDSIEWVLMGLTRYWNWVLETWFGMIGGMIRQLDVYGRLAVFGNDNNFAPVINPGSWEFKEPDKSGVAKSIKAQGHLLLLLGCTTQSPSFVCDRKVVGMCWSSVGL